MPAPTFTLSQIVPECPDTPLRAADETDLTRGNVQVNADCCRQFGYTVRIGNGIPTTTLFLESSVPSCSGTGTGTKVYSGDAVRICGSANGGTRWTITLPNDPAPSFGNPWAEAEISITISGGLLGSPTAFSALAIDIASQGGMTAGAADLQSSINTAAGSSWVAVAGNYNGGAGRTFTLTFASSVPSSIADSGSIVYNLDETGGVTLTGPSTASTEVRAYYRCDWSSCGTGGVVVTQRLESDDSIIATYTNVAFCVKSGLRTILHRQSATCSHPCTGQRTLQQIQGTLPTTLCFEANPFQPTCLGGIKALEYNTELAVASEYGEPASEFVHTFTNSNSTCDFTLPKPTTTGWNVDLLGKISTPSNPNNTAPGGTQDVRLQLTITGGSTVSASACFAPCNFSGSGPYTVGPHPQVSLAGSQNVLVYWQVTVTAVSMDIGGTPVAPGIVASTGITTGTMHMVIRGSYEWTGTPLPDYCDGDLTLDIVREQFYLGPLPWSPQGGMGGWTGFYSDNSEYLPAAATISPGSLSYDP